MARRKVSFQTAFLAPSSSCGRSTSASAPQMTFETCVRQYVAIVSGPSPAARARLVNTPELREQCNALMLYVFGLRKIARSND